MMTSDNGSELIDKFIKVITKKIEERKYSWDFLKGFNTNCRKALSTLAEDDYPQVDLFRPQNLPPIPIPDPIPPIPDILGEYKYYKPFPAGGI